MYDNLFINIRTCDNVEIEMYNEQSKLDLVCYQYCLFIRRIHW